MFYMKNTIKFLVVITLITIIGLSMAGCLSLGGGSGGSGSSSRSATVEWPSNADWEVFGISGLQQPAGTTVVVVSDTLGTGLFQVVITGGKWAFDDLVGQVKRMSGWSVSGDEQQTVAINNSSSTRHQVNFIANSLSNQVEIFAINRR
jgi:hypothetical protein